MNDRLKFRAFYKDFPLCDDEKGDYTKSFMIYNVSPYGGCNVGTYLEDFEDQLTEQGFTEDEIEQVRDYFSHYEYEDWIIFWVDDIEQYTGLRDRNGKLIHEGDIVELKRSRNCGWMEKGRKLEVKYNTDRYCGFGFDGGYALTEKCANNCIVVGNIHENEELLK